MAKQLSSKGLQAIREDADLYAAIAKELKVRPLYMPKLIRENSNRLTEIGAVVLIAEKLGVKAESLIVEKDAGVLV